LLYGYNSEPNGSVLTGRCARSDCFYQNDYV